MMTFGETKTENKKKDKNFMAEKYPQKFGMLMIIIWLFQI